MPGKAVEIIHRHIARNAANVNVAVPVVGMHLHASCDRGNLHVAVIRGDGDGRAGCRAGARLLRGGRLGCGDGNCRD